MKNLLAHSQILGAKCHLESWGAASLEFPHCWITAYVNKNSCVRYRSSAKPFTHCSGSSGPILLTVVFSINREQTKRPQDMVKYLVYEECLLDLFKVCPTCSRDCKVHTFVKGTFLSVTQTCLHQSCLYNRQWKSQPLLGSYPAGNLHLSAAVYYTGSSFVQTIKVSI